MLIFKLGPFEFLKASNSFFQLYTATDADGNRGKCGFTITVLVNSAGRASSNKPELPPPLGPFTNCVDKFLDLFDHLPPSVDIFYLINIDKKVNIFGLPTHLLYLNVVYELHCITQYYAYQGIFWKPGKTSKFQPIHFTI